MDFYGYQFAAECVLAAIIVAVLAAIPLALTNRLAAWYCGLARDESTVFMVVGAAVSGALFPLIILGALMAVPNICGARTDDLRLLVGLIVLLAAAVPLRYALLLVARLKLGLDWAEARRLSLSAMLFSMLVYGPAVLWLMYAIRCK